MNIVKELEKLQYELEKNTYGECLSTSALVDILLEYFKEKEVK